MSLFLHLKIWVLAIIVSSAALAAPVGGNRCEQALLPSQDLSRGLRPDYVAKFLTEANINKRVEVSNQAQITNQGSRGFCHMYSLYAEMVREYKARNNGQDPNISIYYWTYFHWLGRAIQTAQDSKAGLEIPEGNWYENTFDILKHAGVISNEAWKNVGGKTDIELAGKNTIELGQLKTLVASAHIEKSLVEMLLKPIVPTGKTRGDYFSGLRYESRLAQQIDNLIRRKEQDFKNGNTRLTLEQIQRLKKISKGQLQDQQMSDNEIAELISNINNDIAKKIETEFNFMYFGQAENPLGRDNSSRVAEAKTMFPDFMQKTISYHTNGTRKGKTQFAAREQDHLFYLASIESLVSTIKQQVDKDNSVWIGYDHNGYYSDNASGAMTIEGMNSFPVQPHISRNERILLKLNYGGHAVQIVGYELNAENEINAFKIQNSWGTTNGKAGYYRMDMSYFRAYINRVTIRDEGGLFTETKIAKDIQEAKSQNKGGKLTK